MCYKCQVCGFVVGHGHPRRVHIIYRDVPQRFTLNTLTMRMEGVGTRKEISQEIPVCSLCHTMLSKGASLSALNRFHQQREINRLRAEQMRNQPFSPS